MVEKELEMDETSLKILMESIYNANDCPCCCHNEEEIECVNKHSESGCCVVSEYDEIDRCCEDPD